MSSEIFTNTISNYTPGYKVVLSYDIYDETIKNVVRKYAELDLQEGGIDVKSNVELTSFPTMSGFNISDHIFRQPIEVSMKGKFAQNGVKAFGWNGTDRLTKVQEEFETAQRAGIKFNIVIMHGNDVNDESSQRYLPRHNMVLTSIGWSQQQDIIDFSFDFKEAISGSYRMSVIQKDLSDPNLPEITDLEAASLVGELISTDDVISMTIDIMKSLGIVNDGTFWACVGLSAAGYTVFGTTAALLITIAATSTSIPFVGWVVGIGCAIAAGITSVVSAIEAAQRAAYIDKLRTLGHVFLVEEGMTEEEKTKIAEDFVSFLNKVKDNVEQSLSDISVYRIANTNRQECMLNMNGNYYVNQIEKNDDDLTFRIKTLYLGSDEIASKSKITGLESFADCTNTPGAIYFRDISNPLYRVYIVNRASYLQYKRDGITTEDRLNDMQKTDAEKYAAEKNALLEYAFVVAPYPLNDLSEKIAKIIRDTIG